MKLIGSLTSPYVRKARIAFLEKKIDVELIIDPVWSADSQLPGVNPLGKVPALIMEDGGAMFDSRVIVEYADTLSPVGRLIPSTGKEKAAVKTWEALADGVLDAAILVRLEKTWGPRDGQLCQSWVDRQMQKVAAGLQAMSDGLGKNPWCFDNHFGLSDIAVGTALEYLRFRFPEITWGQDYPNLADLVNKLQTRSSFIETAFPA